jgi:hypothetical protein
LAVTTSGRVENFIESLNLPLKEAMVLLECEEDCQKFFTDFYNRNKHVIDDLLDYREYKVEKSQKTLDLFLKECYTSNMRQVFQKTFYQSFSDSDMDLIGQAILDGRTSLEELYSGFKKNPDKNILKNVL